MRRYQILFGSRQSPRLVLTVYAVSSFRAIEQHEDLKQSLVERMEVRAL